MNCDVLAHGDRADDVGAADDSDNLATVHHRQPLDSMGHHELGDLLQGCILPDTYNFFTHDCLCIFAPFGNDIRFRNDAEDFAVFIYDRRTADLIFDQDHGQILHFGAWAHSNDVTGHKISRYHGLLLL